MSKLRLKISMSLDGFVAGPSQSVNHPLGIGGMRLHEWVFPLAAWRAMAGLEGGEINDSNRVVEESLVNIGATVMGRNMFGGHPGPWDAKNPWNGWWGVNRPFHHPVFVLTHHAREPLELEGGTTFSFVTDGFETALERAQRAAGGEPHYDGFPAVLLRLPAVTARELRPLITEAWRSQAPKELVTNTRGRWFEGE